VTTPFPLAWALLMNTDPEIKTIRALIDRMAETLPESIFLVSPETGRTLTFGGLREQSRLLASEFRLAGLKAGDKIAFLLDNGLFTAQLFLGVMYGGFVVVPLNVRAGISQLSYTLNHCDAKIVYVSEDYKSLLEEVLANVPRAIDTILADVDDLLARGETSVALNELIGPGPEDHVLLMYTSGSTGQPKAAVHSHRTVLAGARNSISAHQLSSSDRSLLLLPLYHINAECVTLVPTLMSGGSVVVPHQFSVSQFWDWLDEYRCTWSALVPTIISQLLDWHDPRAESRGSAFKRIRFLRSSSAPLAPSLHREFLEKFNLLLIQAMGSSEAGNIFSNPLPPGENKIGSPGLPWGFEVRIVSAEDVALPAGECGEVTIRGPALMQGYYKQPEETDAVLDPAGWLHTGDLAYRDEDGYFFVVGRSKELIIKGGVNIAPRQIDDVLESHPAVLEAAAVGIPDRYLGEDLVAYVVPRAGVACDESELLRFCEGRLGYFKTPTRIYFADDLPKGPSGKVQRLRLKDDATQAVIFGSSSSRGAFTIAYGNDRADHGSPPAISSIEQIIAKTWAEVLSRPNVDFDSNFFALGGHSLLAVRCVSLLRDRVPVALSLSDFFEHATVAQQAELVRYRLNSDNGTKAQTLADQAVQPLLESQQNASSAVVSPMTIPRRDQTAPCPLSPLQRRLWFMEQLTPGLPVYNEAEAVQLRGDLNIDALERALNVIIARHEVLRTTFRVIDNEPIAFVHESWPIEIKRIDLRALAVPGRQAEVERLLIEEPRRPYHLESEPGIRATLLSLGPRQHIFILMMHHIICDWASMGVLWRELSPLYRSSCCGDALCLPPLAIQYGDYSSHQVQQDAKPSFDGDLAYWEEKLCGAPPLLELPADRPRPPILSYRGARQRISLGPALSKALRDLGQRAETTLFTIFAAGLNALLSRYTGMSDILLGIPVADREGRELQALIGFFLHTHVLRTELSGSMTFRQLLTRVQKSALELYLHRGVPFDQVVRKLQPERNASYSPLFQVMLVWRDADQLLSTIGMDGLTVDFPLAESGTSKFDLTLFVTDAGDDIWLDIEYSTDLFDKERIARMFGHYQTLLECVASNPDRPLSELPLLTNAERHQILIEWNQTKIAYPKDRLLHELIEEQVKCSPDAVAAVFERQQLTYRQLNDRANHLAQHLRELAVGPNVLVGICVERSLEMLVGLFGILKAGGTYVPLDPAYPKDRLALMLDDCQPRVLLTLQRLEKKLPAHHAHVVYLDVLPKATTQNPDLPPHQDTYHPSNLAYVLYTSGSTGRPKGVQISNRALVNFLTSMRREPGLVSNDVLLAVTTLSFDIAGLELFLPLITGARVVIAGAEVAMDGARLSSLMTVCGATVMQATPATWRLLLDGGWQGNRELKILCGGEAWPRALADELLPRCHSLWNMYGPTETTIWSSLARVGPGQPVLLGSPIANTTFHVLDSYQELVPVGVPGELFIGGDGVAEGYLNRPDLTTERFISDPFGHEPGARLYRTGDMVRRLSDGRIEFLHRVDQQVKIRGYRIELGEVEEVLKQHPCVGQCVVVAQEDVPGDKRLHAYIVPRDALVIPGGVELRNFLKQKLPVYMIPTSFVVSEKLPLTPNRKIDRKALSAQPHFSAATGMPRPIVPPRTPVEIELASIWEKVLGVKIGSVDDSFFDLGGHSLMAARMFAEIEKIFKLRLPLATFYGAPTVSELAQILQSEAPSTPWPSLVPIQPSGSRPPFFCFHGAGGNVLIYRELSECLGSDQPFYGLQSQGLDGISPRLKTVAEMAALYVKEIRGVQHQGPYFLGGYCMGGSIAYEAAQQLHAGGEEVALLALFDTMNWHKVRLTTWNRVSRWLQRLVFHVAVLVSLDSEGKRRFLWEKSSALRDRIPVWAGMLRMRFNKRHRTKNAPSMLLAQIWKTNHQASRNYIPKPYPGSVTDFRPARQYRVLDKPNLKWESLAMEGQEVVVIPAYPAAMLVEPFVTHLAAAVRASIDAAIRRRESVRSEEGSSTRVYATTR
jgi:surfactin family lipopeptide synthetase A